VTSSITTDREWNLEGSFSVSGVHLMTSIGHNLYTIAIPRCLRFSRQTHTHLNLLKRGLATIGADASDGSPGPPLFTAMTLNSYS
ncbi:hypothetical protein ALC56_06174, partial [Trachymyrmex septentrionalis]